MNESKQEIVATRVGCLGGSDAKLIQSVAEAHAIPKSAMKRLAVCKGLIEHQQFSNTAIEFGNFVEEQVFESLKAQDARWQSNPCIVSGKYSRKNVNVIDHVDLYLQDDEKKVITIGEVKATRGSYAKTYDEYKWQLMHHYVLGCEKAKELGGYKVRVMLAHYCTNGQNLEDGFEFDPSRLTVKVLRKMSTLSKAYGIEEAMDLIDNFLENFDEYYDGDEIDSVYMPERVKQEFEVMTNVLREIKEREAKIEDFKARLVNFMKEKSIKSIKNDAWSITFVDENVSVSFDSKAYLSDLEAEHPRIAKSLKSKYEKRTKRAASVRIKINDNNNN